MLRDPGRLGDTKMITPIVVFHGSAPWPTIKYGLFLFIETFQPSKVMPYIFNQPILVYLACLGFSLKANELPLNIIVLSISLTQVIYFFLLSALAY